MKILHVCLLLECLSLKAFSKGTLPLTREDQIDFLHSDSFTLWFWRLVDAIFRSPNFLQHTIHTKIQWERAACCTCANNPVVCTWMLEICVSILAVCTPQTFTPPSLHSTTAAVSQDVRGEPHLNFFILNKKSELRKLTSNLLTRI